MSENDERETDDLPTGVVNEAERLTRRAREAVDDRERAAALQTRGELLADHGYTAHVRSDDNRDVLVFHPAEWVEDGTVQPGRIDDLDRGIERPLSGVGEDSWETVETHNRKLVAAIEEAHGAVHGANARALADFAGNHYRKRIEALTEAELALFVEEYYPRNAWPTDEQRAVVEQSVGLVFEEAGKPVPTLPSR